MSEEKCQHNNHSHYFLYLGVFLLWMNTMADCSGDQAALNRRVDTLESQVSSLQSRCR